MNAPELSKHLREQPFVPLRLLMADGSRFDIRHRALAVVTPRTIIWFRAVDRQTGVVDDYDLLSHRHVVRVERLTEPTSAA